jgi:hypothetical protein
MKKWVLMGLLVALAASAGVYFYLNKSHQDIAGAKPELSVKAAEIIHDYETNEQSANTKYLGKLIEVHGVIGTVDKAEDGTPIILLQSDNPMSTVMCQLDPIQVQDNARLESGQTIKIKGLCSGFTTDVVMERCHILP